MSKNKHNLKRSETLDQRLSSIQQERERNSQSSFLKRAADWIVQAYRFISKDMWRLTDDQLSGLRGSLIRFLRVLAISLLEFYRQGVAQMASGLTYKTLLSIVPVLAILISIAAGFGLQDSVQRQLYEYFPAHQEELTMALGFVESYMNQIQGGIVIGVGIVFLFYTVITLLMMVEDVFNSIWQIKKERPISKRIIGYFAGFIILPLSFVASSFANLFVSSLSNFTIFGEISLTPIASSLLHCLPFIFSVAILTIAYLLMPNTRVKFSAALTSGLLAGIGLQLFQMVYITGQLWVTKYNSIYGSVAAIPLLMLYMQLSWVICLFGVQLSYAIQNAKRYVFKSESESVSRRFRDFVAIILMSKITKAFRHTSQSYDLEQLAEECDLPILIVKDTLEKLVAANLLREYGRETMTWSPHYIPAIDIQALTIQRVLSGMDRLGSEDFRVEIYDEYAEEWDIVRRARHTNMPELDTLVADL